MEIDVIYQDSDGNTITEEEYNRITGKESISSTSTKTTMQKQAAEPSQKVEPTELLKEPLGDIDPIPQAEKSDHM